MPITLPNLTWLRGVKVPGFPEFGTRLYQAFSASQDAHNQIEQQTNANLSGQTTPPPALSALRVSAQNGIFHFSISHDADFYRNVHYHVEYATDPAFSNPFPIDLGSAREHRAHLGNLTLYARAATSYGISGPGPWVYYGGAIPKPVTGGGVTGPPLPDLSQGSGTGLPGQGLQGPGTAQWRGSQPPVRKVVP